VSGLDRKAESYTRTMEYCLRELKNRIKERRGDFDLLFSKSQGVNASFQEISLLFFLASVAVTDLDSQKNMMTVRGYEYSTLVKSVKNFLRLHGIRGLDLEYYQMTVLREKEGDERVDAMRMCMQGLYGTDFINAIKKNKQDAMAILDSFIDSLINECPRGPR